ncbi:MAG: ABC transporter ATP-binding protein [Phycisphaerales bacterium]
MAATLGARMGEFGTNTKEPEAVAPLLSVRDLRVHFPVRGGGGFWGRPTSVNKAVDGISLDVGPGECVGLVGESGCGKSTVGRAILRLIAATSGTVRFDDQDVLTLRAEPMRRLRRRMQIIFQDPAGSLNPRMRVGTIVGEPIEVHGLAKGRAAVREKAAAMIERCGLERDALDRYPHEFSGGQRQRIGIARALAVGPAFVVCDEPTSALDVSVQAQILNLLRDLQRDLGLAFLFISHDMAVIRHMCTRVAVMHRGVIVEQGTREEVLETPRHPYTRALLSAVPHPDPRRVKVRIPFVESAPNAA